MIDCNYHNHQSYLASKQTDRWMIAIITITTTTELLMWEWLMNDFKYLNHHSYLASKVRVIDEWLQSSQSPLLLGFLCESDWWVIAIITITTTTELLMWEWLMNDFKYLNHHSYLASKLRVIDKWLQLSQSSLLPSF